MSVTDALVDPLLLVLLPLLWVAGVVISLAGLRRRSAHAPFFCYLFLTITMASVAFLFLSPDEHCRYRSELDPAFVVLFGVLIDACVRAKKFSAQLPASGAVRRSERL